jgi:hypothetical protein
MECRGLGCGCGYLLIGMFLYAMEDELALSV